MRIMVRIAQINLGKRTAAHNELKIRANDGNYELALIQEPVFTKRGTAKVYGGTNFAGTAPNRDRRPRTAIWVHDRLCTEWDCMQLNEFSDEDMTTISANICIQGTRFVALICSIYMPHLNQDKRSIRNPVSGKLKSLVKYANDNRCELLIAIDSNSHHKIWGCPQSDVRGGHLHDFITSNRLCLMNTGSAHTFHTDTRKSIIDITLATRKMQRFLSNWKVDSSESHSDHKFIELELPNIPTRVLVTRNKRETDWVRYSRKLERRTARVSWTCNDRVSLDLKAQRLADILMKSYSESSREKLVKARHYMDWYSKGIASERTKLRKLGKIAHKALEEGRINADTLLTEYRNKRNKYHRTVDKARRKAWWNKMEEIKLTKETARLQKILENGGSKSIGSLRRGDDSYTCNMQETIELLMQTHFPDCEKQSDTNVTEVPEQRYFGVDFTDMLGKSKIEWAIRTLSPFKTAGGDGIFPALLQKGMEFITPVLHALFTASIELNYIPKTWRDTKVVFIPKAGKSAYDVPKSFRPISLMSFILKTLEKLVDREIKENNLTINPLDKAQHAYQKGKSTESALHSFVTEIEKMFHHKKLGVGLFIDIEGAFDNTSFEVIMRAARRFGISEALITWIKAMLMSRRITATIDKEGIEYSPTRGCPQGGCLSPLLWSLIVDDLAVQLKEAECFVSSYADDMGILVQGDKGNTDEIEAQLYRAIRIIEKWCADNRLKVNPSKSVTVIFSRMSKRHTFSNFRMFGGDIPMQNDFKYLGVHLDSKLMWDKQITQSIEKGRRTVGITNAMVTKKYGLSVKQAIWVYTQIVLPRMTYGCIVWWHRASEIKGNRERLESVQRKALMMATGAMTTTPSAALTAILNIIPLHLKIRESAMKCSTRLLGNGTWRTDIPYGMKKAHSGILETTVGLAGEDMDLMDAKFLDRNNFEIKINPGNNWSYRVPLPPASTWYVDASRRNKVSTIGMYSKRLFSLDYCMGMRIDDHATSFQAEMFAIKKAAELCLNAGYRRDEQVTIVSDSEASIKALSNAYCRSRLTNECFEFLTRLGDRCRLTLAWCPAHKGIYGNTKADNAARLARDKPTTNGCVYIGFKQVIERIEKASYVQAKIAWAAMEIAVQSRNNIAGYDEDEARPIMNLGRRDIRALIGMKTGHAVDYKFLMRKDTVESDLCRYCHDGQDSISHFTFDCHYFDIERQQILKIGPGTSNLRDTNHKNIIEFVRKTGLMDDIFDKRRPTDDQDV